jgi:hypothetical protein
VYLFALESGCLPKHAKTTLEQMQKEGLIHNRTLHVSYDAWKKWKKISLSEKIEIV